MRRLAWAFAGRLCDKYHNLMSWLSYCTTCHRPLLCSQQRTGLRIKRSWVRIPAVVLLRRGWKYAAIQSVSFFKQINGEIIFPKAVAKQCPAKSSTRYRSCPIDISPDIGISLYSEVNIMANKKCCFFFCFFFCCCCCFVLFLNSWDFIIFYHDVSMGLT